MVFRHSLAPNLPSIPLLNAVREIYPLDIAGLEPAIDANVFGSDDGSRVENNFSLRNLTSRLIVTARCGLSYGVISHCCISF